MSVLEDKGIPSMVGRTLIRPPSAQVGPLNLAERDAVLANSPVGGLYDAVIDRESAFEILERRARDRQLSDERAKLETADRIAAEKAEKERERSERVSQPRRTSNRQTPAEAAMNSLARTVANRLGSAIVRGILGGLKGRR